MKNYAFITRDFHILPVADRLLDDGKNVVVGMVQEEENKKTPEGKSEARLSLYDGILDKHDADDVIEWLEKLPDDEKGDWFLMFDYGDLYEYSERALKAGFTKGIFPTEEGYELEKDRTKGKEFAKKHYPALKVAEAHEFKKVDDAIKFLEEDKENIYVLKSEGSNAETVVPQTEDVDLGRRQVIGALRTEAKDYEKGGFTLEPRILKPVELSPVMLFWNGKPLFSLVELENKPLGAGNIGRLTGGCQNLSIRTPLDCELNKIAFPPIVYEMAKKTPGIGLFDAGLLYDGKEFFFTEFCAQRWGFDGIFSEIAMCGDEHGHGNAVNHFDKIAAGEMPLAHSYGAAVRLFQTEPDGKSPDMYQGGYAVDWMDEVSDQLFLYCIERKKVEGGEEGYVFVSNGYEKEVGTATGTGDTAIAAVERAYVAAAGIAMTGLMYRPRFDFVSRQYFTSIWNRLDFLTTSGLLNPSAKS